MITVYIKVKFRAFGVTFSTFEKTIEINVGVPLPSYEGVLVNERGVYLKVSA